MNISTIPNYIRILATFTLSSFIILGLIYLNPIAFAVISMAIIFLIVTLINPRIGLFGLLIVRSSIDIFKDQSLYTFGGYDLNIASLVSIGVFIIGLITLAIDLFIHKHEKTEKSQSFFVTAIFTAWMGTNLISIFISQDITTSAIEYLRIFDFFIIFLLAKRFITEIDHFRQLIRSIFISSIIPIVVAYYQILTGQGASDTVGISFRIQSTFAHSNLFAFYLVFLLTFLIITFFTTQKDFLKPMIGMYIFIVLVPLIFTFTRAAWLAIAFVVTMLSLLRFQSLLMIIPLGTFPLFLFFPEINNRIYDLLHWEEDTSILWRLKLWEIMSPYINEKPYFGHGLDQFTLLTTRMIGFEMPAHNDYIKMAVETGMIGFSLFVLLLISILYYLIKLVRTTNDLYLKNITFGVISLFLVYFFISGVDNLIEATAIQWFFWSILGGIIGLEKQFHQNK